MESLVVGSGLTGAVIARYLAEELRWKVTVIDRRNQIAGNMFDFVDEHGVLVHQYGPHSFHTKKKYLLDYMSRYSNWEPFYLTCMAKIDDKFTPTPFNFQTIDDYFSLSDAAIIKKKLLKAFPGRETMTILELLDHEDESINKYANFLFEKDYKLYTAKQWGVDPSEIDKSVLQRVPVRFSYKREYFDDEFQFLPTEGYTHFFMNLLDHPNIKVELGIEALEHVKISPNSSEVSLDGQKTNMPIVYTGAIDELFGACSGSLPYRSLRFEWVYDQIDSFQEAPVVAYPQEEFFTRITEYKKLPIQNVTGTSYAIEYPIQYYSNTKMEPYYPILTENSKILFGEYKERSKQISNLFCCGRLADFMYYNMDQALERALDVCSVITKQYS